ncbi:MAG: hypothetical protein ACR2QF_11900 [Geminicoccaceae bacterium]
MTTIALRDGIMVADGLSVAGDLVKSTTEKKIIRLNYRQSLVACCGRCSCIERFLEALSNAGHDDKTLSKDLKVEEGFHAIEARQNGEVWIWEDGLNAYQQNQEFHAIGTGFELAWGAMQMGATAEQAVIVAAKCNIYTGGEIQVETVA